ncbi:MAG: two-component system response regulator [Rhodospirillaceae bacterium]|nr:two-component system response regulator [Rhodospirillaceae bacterium]
MTAHILLVEDDALISGLLEFHLKSEGYGVDIAATVEDALTAVEAHPPDLILTDLGLPDEDGLALIRKVRGRSNVPIIVLSARTTTEQRLAALELGADDYLTKGVDPGELLLRIRNTLARAQSGVAGSAARGPAQSSGGDVSRFSGWTVNFAGYTAQNPKGEDVEFTRSEFLVLAALARHPGRVVSRDALLDAISGFDDAPLDRTIDTYISRLRRKIEPDPKNPTVILTMKGVGYRVVE